MLPTVIEAVGCNSARRPCGRTRRQTSTVRPLPEAFIAHQDPPEARISMLSAQTSFRSCLARFFRVGTGDPRRLDLQRPKAGWAWLVLQQNCNTTLLSLMPALSVRQRATGTHQNRTREDGALDADRDRVLAHLPRHIRPREDSSLRTTMLLGERTSVFFDRPLH